MKKNLKYVLLGILTVALFLGIVWGAGVLTRPAETQAASTGEINNVDNKTVTASGIGNISVKPDVAYVTLGAQTKKMSAADASEENAKIMEAVLKAIKTEGIKDDDIETAQFSITPQYNYNNSGNPTFDGYQVINLVTIKIKNIDKASMVLDKAVTAGANQVSSISFDIEERSKAYEDALELAVKDAGLKATVMMKAAGVTQELKPYKVVEASYNVYPLSDGSVRDVMDEAETATQIMPGTLKVTAQVEVTFTWTP
mgnify:CR=1 FL=1